MSFSLIDPRGSSPTRRPNPLQIPLKTDQIALFRAASASTLSPPLSDDSKHFDRPPFKAPPSDTTSLSMKTNRKHKPHNRRKDARTSMDATKIDDRLLGPTTPYRSLPDLKVRTWLDSSPSFLRPRKQDIQITYNPLPNRLQEQSKNRQATLPRKPRRWTVPSKARPVQIVSGMLSPASRQPIIVRSNFSMFQPALDTTSRRTGERADRIDFGPGASTLFTPDTPAMILLRRATTNYAIEASNGNQWKITEVCQDRPSGKSTLFSSVVAGKKHDPATFNSSSGKQNRHPSAESISQRKVSVGENRALPYCSAKAVFAITEISVTPTILSQSASHTDCGFGRRCSTKIVSGNNIHDIIWEGNDMSGGTSSSESKSRRTASSGMTPKLITSRNPSIVVERLKSQLQRNEERRRSISAASHSPHMQFVDEEEALGLPQKRFLNWKWTGQNRTRATSAVSHVSMRGRKQDDHFMHQAVITQDDNAASHVDHVDFFPPLPSRRNSNAWRSPSHVDLNIVCADDLADGHLQDPISAPTVAEMIHNKDITISRKSIGVLDELQVCDIRHSLSTKRSSRSTASNGGKNAGGSAIGVSSHVRRKSPDFHTGHTISPRTSLRIEKCDNPLPFQARVRDASHRHSEVVISPKSKHPSVTSRRSSVQEFIAKFEAQNDALRRACKSSASDRKSSCAGRRKISRNKPGFMEELEEDTPAAFDNEAGIEEASAGPRGHGILQNMEGSCGGRVSVDWIG